jgi:signal transduction histidine kinase
MAATLAVWRRLSELELDAAQEAFRNDAALVAESVRREVALFMDVLGSLRDLHDLSDRISADEFAEFVDKGMLHQKRIVGAFGFVQRVDDERRQTVEAGNNGLLILEPSRDGTFVRADRRETYFPVTSQMPDGGLRVPNGFDFFATEPNSSAIAHMMASGGITLGGPAPGEAAARSFYVFAPILYASLGDLQIVPPGYLVGFVAAILDPGDVIGRAIGDTALTHMSIQCIPDAEPGAPEPFVVQSPIAVADRTWLLRCRASDRYVEANLPHRANIALGAGLLLTAFITAEFILMAGRNRRTERLVRERTAALRDAKEHLEVEMAERRRLEAEVLEIASREQERVGRDLHDSLGQKLTGASFLSRALSTRLADAQRPEHEEALKINEIIKDAVGQVRRIARGLSPVEFDEDGLADALQRLGSETETTYGVTCSVKTDGARTFPGRAAVQVYHIAQEAISNAIRHGTAKHIAVTLNANEFSIVDDGSGIPPDATRSGGMGLKIMRYRASLLGATLDVRPGERGGTVVSCRFA